MKASLFPSPHVMPPGRVKDAPFAMRTYPGPRLFVLARGLLLENETFYIARNLFNAFLENHGVQGEDLVVGGGHEAPPRGRVRTAGDHRLAIFPSVARTRP